MKRHCTSPSESRGDREYSPLDNKIPLRSSPPFANVCVCVHFSKCRVMERFLKRAREETSDSDKKEATVCKQPEDVEGKIVRYILDHADFGYRGTMSTKGSLRKVLLLGKPYYWENKAQPLEELPPYFKEFARKHGVEDCNSILCNVYTERNSKIGLHMDNTRLLQPGKGGVSSISLAVHMKDRAQKLSTMVFQGKTGLGYMEKELYHGTCITFDAFEDFRVGRHHAVFSTLHPRINLTYRHLK